MSNDRHIRSRCCDAPTTAEAPPKCKACGKRIPLRKTYIQPEVTNAD
ncbi:MAG: hypothetical protein ABEN55_13440 [Bradymonadaceae bacterium]